jgi:hypothetical protein
MGQSVEACWRERRLFKKPLSQLGSSRRGRAHSSEADWAEAGATRLYLQTLDIDDLDHLRLIDEQVRQLLP